jgi:MOSC domain-containing protein YiiM
MVYGLHKRRCATGNGYLRIRQRQMASQSQESIYNPFTIKLLTIKRGPMSGELLGIAVRSKSRAPMQECMLAELDSARGVCGDSQGKGERPVTLMSAELWQDAQDELEEELPWTLRRANLLMSGLDFSTLQGCELVIGDCRLVVRDTTPPCPRMDEQVPGLTSALGHGRCGLWATVESPGQIQVGDTIQVTGTPPPPRELP